MLSLKWQQCFLVLGSILAFTAAAQTPPTTLVIQLIDESKLVTLPGSVHPLVQAAADRGADRGAVSDSFPTGRLLLMLNRPAEREAALDQFLHDAHTRGTASYHQWLTPEQFGAQFGAADSDVQIATSWLSARGFSVAKTSKGRQFIEFSGTAGAVRAAFHTEIHRYEVQGETHYANASEVKIPAALAALVRGVSPMNDFRAKPQVQVNGPALYSPSTKKTKPQWTMPNSNSSGNFYAVAPADFATQYDLGPLYKAGINGAGQTIGIINESNIDLGLVQAYQSLFGVAGTTPQVVIDGDDPGNLNGVNVEAYLDVELSGAVAPKATVNLYIANASNLIDPLELAALRAVEDNQAAVLSVSFGACEGQLAGGGNQFWNGLWEQAAAQGQTVLVSTGDTGSECALQPDWVNGLASTPWNIAVGGTDFYYPDYATGGASAAGDWNQSNDGNLGSLKAPLTEQVWNDGYGFNLYTDAFWAFEQDAGGGGASNCTVLTSSACTSGYAKPAWQTGAGVPADKARDLPDVSLFASNGANFSAIAICASEGECAGPADDTEIYLVGGTSASAPAMAGIMALVNQKYGRQGQADYTLYPLAQQKPAAFHDITLGGNTVECVVFQLPATGCTEDSAGNYISNDFLAGPGFDLASGLGSVDASVLVNDWNSIAFKPTATTLQLSSTSVTHGAKLTLTASVAPGSGSGTPTGAVAILSNSTNVGSQSQTAITLSDGTGTTSLNTLPGGTYELTARYGGDGAYSASTSSPESLTVTPEKSNINFFAVLNGTNQILSGGYVPYNAPFALLIQPIGGSAATGKTDGYATGTATFTVDSTSVTVALDSGGYATWTPPALAVGPHTASASYSGDASFAAATAASVTFSVVKGQVSINDNIIGPYTYLPGNGGPSLSIGSSVTLSASVKGSSTIGASPSQIPLGTAAPTGTVQLCLGLTANLGFGACQNPVYSQTVPLSALSGSNAMESLGEASFSNLAAGNYYLSVEYSGDANWAAYGLLNFPSYSVQTMPAAAATTTAVSISPTSFSGTQTATITATVTGTGNGSTSPTGEIDFYNNDVLLTESSWATGGAGKTSTVTFDVNPSWFLNSGTNQLTAMYWGDSANAPSVGNVVSFTSTQLNGTDFTMAPQQPRITVQAGSTGTVGLNLTPLSGFNGAVALTCAPSSSEFSCSVNPASPTLNGSAVATLTINASIPTTAQIQPMRQGLPRWPMAAGMLAFVLFLAGGRTRRAFARTMLLSFALLATLGVASCGVNGGSGGGGGTNPPPNSTPAGTYSVLVTATGSGVVHNAKITVVVP
jgi:Pro-kumamolisin, activation domain/Bacterial Ig-like domain (group 3)